MEDNPTELTQDDIDHFLNHIMNQEIKFPKCSWCKDSSYVREVGPNYICPDCEMKEKKEGRPLSL
jgi:hypothetical protein